MKERSEETISYTMSRIKGKNTGIEIKLRKALYESGVRYRCNSKYIFGHPDISMKGYKIAIFCDSEFWHGYDWENQKDRIGTRREYWLSKIERNMERDREVNESLQDLGYLVLRFWGKSILKNPSGCADEIESVLNQR